MNPSAKLVANAHGTGGGSGISASGSTEVDAVSGAAKRAPSRKPTTTHTGAGTTVDPDPAPDPAPVPEPIGDGNTSAKRNWNYVNADLAKQYHMSKEVAYQEAFANTSAQRHMADLQAAGLNPVLAATNGGAGGGISVGGSGGGGGGGSRRTEEEEEVGLIGNIAKFLTGNKTKAEGAMGIWNSAKSAAKNFFSKHSDNKFVSGVGKAVEKVIDSVG